MTSFRRNSSIVRRDGNLHNDHDDTDASPKPSHIRNFLIMGRLLNSLLNSLHHILCSDRIRAALHKIFFQRPSRPTERLKVKIVLPKSAAFRLLICFVVGFFCGYTPTPLMNVTKNREPKLQAFSFHEDKVVADFGRRMSVEEEVLSFHKTLIKENTSKETWKKGEVKDETFSTVVGVPLTHDKERVSKLVIVVTPIYAWPLQVYYLNRLAQTLRNVPPPLLWIVVEMSVQSDETARILREAGVMHRHLVCHQNVTSIKTGVIHQRNVALSHIEKHQLDGIVYFADDNRIYSIELFAKMREIRRFGTWPVAVLTENKKRVVLEGPVCNGSEVLGWHTNQKSKESQRFNLDISGFAFNSTLLWDTKSWHRPAIELIRHQVASREVSQESKFIEQLVEDESQMEGISDGCSRVLVWHLHLELSDMLYPEGWLLQKNLDVVIPLP
ncbi:hypothetical protein HPP92_023302 [Vanilla planifolia]|uniref:Glycosyltransferases n=1 Tax=Vanilla planifolia TaxID=51239 RepID=A0A835PT35_VANPL|nr:hypothetical protein HPP92_023302 [Vanilla planifolia]